MPRTTPRARFGFPAHRRPRHRHRHPPPLTRQTPTPSSFNGSDESNETSILTNHENLPR
jgi:hypothetical protein